VEAAEGMLGGLKSIVLMSNEATLDVSMRPSCIRAPLRVLLYSQDYWKFNHLECAMCVAAAMCADINVHLPPKPPYWCFRFENF
jgi:hypothetical protein